MRELFTNLMGRTTAPASGGERIAAAILILVFCVGFAMVVIAPRYVQNAPPTSLGDALYFWLIVLGWLCSISYKSIIVIRASHLNLLGLTGVLVLVMTTMISPMLPRSTLPSISSTVAFEYVMAGCLWLGSAYADIFLYMARRVREWELEKEQAGSEA